MIDGDEHPSQDEKQRAHVPDAFVPENGQSVFDFIPADRVAQIYDSVRENGAGWLMPLRSAALFDVNAAHSTLERGRIAVHPGNVDLKSIIVDRDFSIDQTRALRPELMTIV